MSVKLENPLIDFFQALQMADREKVLSSLISVIQLDEYIEEHIRKQRIEELLHAYHIARNIA